MKIGIAAFIAFLLSTGTLMAQSISVDISYKYLYANQWDKAIQTYNFSRPFLEEKQPLLTHGVDATLGYIFASESRLKQGIGLGYSFFSSAAENANINNTLSLHLLNLSYLLHYEYSKKATGLYSDLSISATATGLFRYINDEAFVVDESNVKAFGLGGTIHLKTGYRLPLKGQFSLSPFLAVGYSPYLAAPGTERVINQTQGLASAAWTGMLTAQLGLSVHFQTKKE